MKTSILVARTREEIKNIMEGVVSNKLIVIVGPCSIHDPKAAIEYARRLSSVKDRFNKMLIIMRAYFEKPRTVLGWKGLIYDPDLDGSCNLQKGLNIARKILLDILDTGITPGTEFLDTILPQYYSDLITWGAVGARTTESQTHRQLASGLSCPIGFKNNSAGNCKVAIDASIMARHPHAFPGVNTRGDICLVKTTGNPCTHVILRGSYDSGPNFEMSETVFQECVKRQLGAKIMIDCSHGNSNKDHHKQINVVDYVVSQIQAHGTFSIGGVMIESNLFEGKQSIGPDMEYGVSVTDACIGFETTILQLKKLNDAVAQIK
jgi:3-deoxy-7-phosphoheptulonate synthase